MCSEPSSYLCQLSDCYLCQLSDCFLYQPSDCYLCQHCTCWEKLLYLYIWRGSLTESEIKIVVLSTDSSSHSVYQLKGD